MTSKRWILAVDGGGTSTDVAIARLDKQGQAEIIARATGAATNFNTLGHEQVLAELQRVIHQSTADLDDLEGPEGRPKFERALIALAGAGDVREREQLAAWLTKNQLADTVSVVSDAELTLTVGQCSAPADHATIALIAGTGSIAFGCMPDSDELVRAGGWGPSLGDDGSGYWLGRAAIRHTLNLLDRGLPLTGLGESLLSELQVASSRDLVGVVTAGDDVVRRVAALTPLVIQSAEQGDSAAQQLVAKAADHLCELVTTVSRRLEHPPQQTSVVCSGSFATKASSVTRRLEEFAQQGGFAAIYFLEDPVTAGIQIMAAAQPPASPREKQ